jgi:RHS repeat-associated protein
MDDGPVTYTYDQASRLKTTSDSRGTTTYVYDDAGVQTAQYTTVGEDESWTRFAIDDQGRRTDTWMTTNEDNTAWAAHTHTDFDSSGRIVRITAESSDWGTDVQTVMDVSYCYTAGTTAPACTASTSGDRSMLQWRKDNLTGQVATYTYDQANRLTAVAITAGTDADNNPIAAQSFAYTYDVRGNRLTATVENATQTRTFNAGNQITTAGFGYDGAGNLTSSTELADLEYTAGDQLTSIDYTGHGIWTYEYAGIGNGELLAQKNPNDQYGYGRTNALGKPVVEQVRHAGSRAYMENDANGTPIIIRSDTGNIADQSLYVYDNLGSPTGLITQNNTTNDSWEYDPYGVTEVESTNGSVAADYTPFGYTGGVVDHTTGLVLNGARYYDPWEGRWTQLDTLDPSNANRYAYAATNPINFTDPMGLSVRCSVAGLAGGLLGGIAGGGIGLIGGVVGAAIGASVGTAIGAGFTAGACASTKKTPAGRAADGAAGAGWAVAGTVVGAVGGVIGTVANG